jgi:hypothetical protein
MLPASFVPEPIAGRRGYQGLNEGSKRRLFWLIFHALIFS